MMATVTPKCTARSRGAKQKSRHPTHHMEGNHTIIESCQRYNHWDLGILCARFFTVQNPKDKTQVILSGIDSSFLNWVGKSVLGANGAWVSNFCVPTYSWAKQVLLRYSWTKQLLLSWQESSLDLGNSRLSPPTSRRHVQKFASPTLLWVSTHWQGYRR